MVAQSLGRRAVLIDLNAEYLEQAMERNRDIPLGLGV
jgi:DNA modification methylase